jgi:YegS/Rv2252/BmrU family lipid kinase
MSSADKGTVWFAVINVYAASSKAAKSWAKAEERMKAKGMVFHGSRTGKGGSAMELTFDACMAGYRKFIAVGGDGTVHDVLNGIAGYVDWTQESGRPVSFSDFTIGVIPVGSGNDWIKTAGVPKDIEKAVDVLEAGCLSKQDVVRVSLLEQGMPPHDRTIAMSYMMNIGGIGIDARVCEAVNAQKRQGKRGKILYVTALLKAIFERVPADAKVICDGQTVFDGLYFSMAFGVGKYSGGGMRQTPEAVMDDGLLDMTIIPEIPMRRIMREAPRLFTDTFLKVPELIVAKSKVITVMPGSAACAEPVEVDGEVVGKAPVRFEVLDNQINVVIKA